MRLQTVQTRNSISSFLCASLTEKGKENQSLQRGLRSRGARIFLAQTFHISSKAAKEKRMYITLSNKQLDYAVAR